ncbi:DUF4169 domain-containing protein [Rhodobacteraceae bacterium 2CG4]|uniref:DUF4169 domain-containing protein n=1 Tax=Halovulum marinum TaxID=2662447 RepID=A0A6L5YXS0_9RHOB|nr:DUF4169 domain-containing protein [Halovulum marinum]MSU89037.1 DUF4169 domain-containing protein [Halovulum marinum]
MTGQTINLRRARKARSRAEKRARSDAETRAGTAAASEPARLDRARRAQQARQLDGHRLEDSPDDDAS